MHSSEFKELAQLMDEVGEVVEAFAPKRSSATRYVILTYSSDQERWFVYPDMMMMRHRDYTFMQWAPHTRQSYGSYYVAAQDFAKLT